MADPTRDVAFDLLTAVLDRHRALDEALDARPGAEPRDRAAGHRIAASVLRRLGTLDAVLEPFLRRAPPDPVRHILRIGAASLVLLGTPAHAAVATAVALARSRGLVPFAGLVNAVLRRVAEQGASALDGLDSPRLDTPAWLWASWGRDARAIAEAHQTEAPLDLTLRPSSPTPQGAELLPTGTARLPPGTRVTDLPGFAEGAFWVQDAAAALPARLLNVRPGELVADLCAAPGGKTAQLAAAGAAVIAVERDRGRIVRLRENLDRLTLSAEIVEADATSWHSDALFDAVLLDAPCSATGTIRRHPDIPHLKRASDVAAVGDAQEALLDAAVRLLRPGARLVYAVCSLQPEEGRHQIAALLGRSRLVLDPVRADELPGLAAAIGADGTVRTLPSMWREQGGMDGFYIARLRKPD
jgi:16S rRNA (cytosine967-C5)-methyltransferase